MDSINGQGLSVAESRSLGEVFVFFFEELIFGATQGERETHAKTLSLYPFYETLSRVGGF